MTCVTRRYTVAALAFGLLLSTPVRPHLTGYRPVINAAREGVQTGLPA